MTRTKDIVTARLRIVARRWWPGDPVLPSDAWAVPAAGVATRAPVHGDPWVDHDAEAAASTDEPWADAGRGPAPVRPSAWLALVGLLAVGALLVGAVAVVRSWPRPDHAGPTPIPTGSALALVPLAEPSASPSVVVHVVGEVRRPGVIRLPAGARVGDAVAAAGGLRKGGRIGGTNLARPVSDGEQIEIGPSAPAEPSTTGSGVPGAGSPVDLNAATAAQLETLPGIGPVTAAKILAWRTEHGRFSVVDELAEVPGIGPKRLEQLRPHVKV